MYNTSAIVCAYNEEKTILRLLEDVCKIDLFDEIIVVNDGSTDQTASIVKTNSSRLNYLDLHLKKNMGKGFAMAKGIVKAKSEILVFIDADLSNFTTQHALQLIEPLELGEADMVLGQATETLINNKVNPFKTLSGQRSVKKADIFKILERMRYSGYGVETLINIHFNAEGKNIKYVKLDKLIHPTKFQKTDAHSAFRGFVKEGFQILITAFSNIDLSLVSGKNKIESINY